MGRSQSLAGIATTLADASPESLRSLPRPLLQRLRDRIQFAISKTNNRLIQPAVPQANNRPIQPTVPQANNRPIQPAVSLADDNPEQVPASNVSANPAHRLLESIKKKAKNVSNLLDQNVEVTLRDGSRQPGEDPRIDDVSRTANSSTSDKLRSNLSCWNLLNEYERFSNGKRRRYASPRIYANSVRIKNVDKLTLALADARRMRAAVAAYEKPSLSNDHIQESAKRAGTALIVLLIFGNWTRLSVSDMGLFGTLCGSERSIIRLLGQSKTKIFTTSCLKIYPEIVRERREMQPTLGKHMRDASVTTQNAKKQCRLPRQEEPDYKSPNCDSQAKDTVSSRVELGRRRGGERDRLQALSDLHSTEQAVELTYDSNPINNGNLPWDSNLAGYTNLACDSNPIDNGNLPWDSNLAGYTNLACDSNPIDNENLPWDSNLAGCTNLACDSNPIDNGNLPWDSNLTDLHGFVPTRNETQLHVTVYNVDYISTRPQPAASVHDPIQS
jgi:hypothetical protein